MSARTGSGKTPFPRHMKRAVDRLSAMAPGVNLVFEILDARAPLASSSPDLTRILENAAVLRVLTRADLVPSADLRGWLERFSADGKPALGFSSKRALERKRFLDRLERHALSPLRREKRVVRALVVGVPNVGKSTFINFLVKRRSAPVGAAPGVTRGFQLIAVSKGFYVYDTPGVLQPGSDSPDRRRILGLIGSLREPEFDVEDAAGFLFRFLKENAPGALKKYVSDDAAAPESFHEFCNALAARRGFLARGGIRDLHRACRVFVEDFSRGRTAGVSLQAPPEKARRRNERRDSQPANGEKSR
ncbi:MAG: YlqF/YawG family GTPase [bacterium]